MSSATFAITASSTASPSMANPCASLAPPVPPASRVTLIGGSVAEAQDATSIGFTSVISRSIVSSSYGDGKPNEVPEAGRQERAIVLCDLLRPPDRLVAPRLGAAVVGIDRLENALRLGRVVADDGRSSAEGALDLRLVAADLVAVPSQDLVLPLHVVDAASQIAGVGPLGNDPERLPLPAAAHEDGQAILDRPRLVERLLGVVVADPDGFARRACRA